MKTALLVAFAALGLVACKAADGAQCGTSEECISSACLQGTCCSSTPPPTTPQPAGAACEKTSDEADCGTFTGSCETGLACIVQCGVPDTNCEGACGHPSAAGGHCDPNSFPNDGCVDGLTCDVASSTCH